MNQLIAIVEDESDISDLIKIHTEKAGYIARCFLNGMEFHEFLKKNIPDLVLLDLMLPDMDGIELCKFIRSDNKLKKVPIIILSAKSDEIDRILGIEIGADYYLTKPFSIKELLVRIKTLLRDNTSRESNSILTINNILLIDQEKYIVKVKGQPVQLTSAEFNLLRLLASKKGIVFTRDKILNYLWGEDKIVLDRTIDVHIKNIREKLGEAGKFVQNVRGIGYKLDSAG
jgi:two-component system phosphate regulon response regulator PhoB/two-component system alkaline phosphatase synthesis response regulator PhoP